MTATQLYLTLRLTQLARAGQPHAERTALAKLAGYVQPAAVHVFHDVLGERESQSGALGHLAVFPHAIKLFEHFLAVFFAQTDAGILDLELHLILRPVRPVDHKQVQGNHLLMRMFGTDVTILEDPSTQKAAIQTRLEELRAQGRNAYRPREDDVDDLDALAYAEVAMEIVQQCREMAIEPAFVYAAALDTTQAGLVLGMSYLESPIQVRCFSPFEASSRRFDELARIDRGRFPPHARFRVFRAADAETTGEGRPGKLEEAVLELAQAGFTVQRILDVIPEPDLEIYRALVLLADAGTIDPLT